MKKEQNILPENIKSILFRYYEGLTSIEEERLLKKYFMEHQIPESLLTDQAILSNGVQTEIPFNLTNELWDKIKQNELTQSRFRLTIRMASSIAASILILISLGVGYYLASYSPKDILVLDTYSNPEEAYKVVQKYLGFASTKLTYAYNEIKPIERLKIPSEAIISFSEIDENFNRLNGLDKLNLTSQELKRFSKFNEIIRVDENN